ncbi:MAG: ATP-binding protein [Oscillospiraceae bacterium]|nr:ATP-binding protein [Oscillospiraceae bacterium]MBQ4643009.1 ATP-binding protein [Oscillospiraceae bacterium]
MAYSSEVYAAAKRIIDERRSAADREANIRKSDVYAKFPAIRELDNQLMREMAGFSVLMLREQKETGAAISEMQDKISRIQSEKAAILASNGLPADYLEPRYTCKKCSDLGRKNGILCSCYKEVCREQALRELAASSGSAACSFDNFDLSYYADNGASDGTNPRRKMQNYYNFCINYAKGFSNDSPSIVMMGKTGLGKTHLSLSIAKTVTEGGFGVVYAPAQKLVSDLEREHFSFSGSDSAARKYAGCELLIIDDLGAEFPSQFTTAAIGNLINERLYENRPTIISTNLSGKELAERYSERTASRILGEYRKLYFVGEDIRFLKNR